MGPYQIPLRTQTTNEQTTNLKVVHVYDEARKIPPTLAEHLATIDRIYPRLKVDFVAVKGTFTPELVEALSSLRRPEDPGR